MDTSRSSTETDRGLSPLRSLLVECGQEKHHDVLIANEMTPGLLADCEAADLTSIGLPLGAAKLVIKAAANLANHGCSRTNLKAQDSPAEPKTTLIVAGGESLLCQAPKCANSAEKACRLADRVTSCGKSFCEAHLSYLKSGGHTMGYGYKQGVDGFQCAYFNGCCAELEVEAERGRAKARLRIASVVTLVFAYRFLLSVFCPCSLYSGCVSNNPQESGSEAGTYLHRAGRS
jgi:hypothetical protein